MSSPRRLQFAALLASVAITCAMPASAQRAPGAGAPSDSASTTHPDPVVAAGLTGGALHFADGRGESGVSAIVELHPLSWLTLSVNPSYVHATDSSGAATQPVNGFADLPIGIAASHEFELAWSPTIGGSFELSVPVGDTASGLGSGKTSTAVDLSVGVSPVDRLSLGVDAWHGLGGAGVASALGAASGTSLSGEASLQLADRASASLGYSTDLGVDSADVAARSMSAGLALPLPAHWVLTMDGSHGFTRGAPDWSFALGIGTSFSAFTHVDASFRRLRSAFARSVNRGSGRGHLGRGIP